MKRTSHREKSEVLYDLLTVFILIVYLACAAAMLIAFYVLGWVMTQFTIWLMNGLFWGY